MIRAASGRLASSLASSHMPARMSALTSARCVFGFASAHAFVTPKTFSGLSFQIS
jgi:hypothetical protein